MNITLMAAFSFALLLMAAALCREVRLRRSLQRLLRRLLSFWRTAYDQDPSQDADSHPDRHGGRL